MGEDREILTHIHRLHLMLADELKRICEKNGIQYFMIAGTLLGAVRHGGFIPWDDDMDFGMLREDYNKFLEAARRDLDTEKYCLQTEFGERYYTFGFGKLRLNGTRILEAFSADVPIHQGIYIDIFPFDAVSDNRFQAEAQHRSFYFYRSLLWVKCGYGSPRQKAELRYKAVRLLARFFSIEFLKRQKYRSVTRYLGTSTRRVVTADGTYGFKQETLKTEWVTHLKEYRFEDRVYPGIADCDGYLSYFYGDYRTLPPEIRENQHERLAVDFGEYG